MPVRNAHDLLELLISLLSGVAPAGIGSAVGQAWKPGLGLKQRVLQWLVGICVSYFVTRALTVLLHWHEFVAQAIGFLLAMTAFEFAPKLVSGVGALADKLASVLPDVIVDVAKAWIERFRPDVILNTIKAWMGRSQ